MKIKNKLLSGFLLITFLVAAFGIFVDSGLNQIITPLQRELPEEIEEISNLYELDTLSRRIRYYDEVLSMSARSYAFTEDLMWKQRYNEAEPILDESINQAIQEGDEIDKNIFGSINEANIALVKLEKEAINLVDSGDSEGARSILESNEYWNLKDQYQTAISQYAERRGDAVVGRFNNATQGLTDSIDDAVKLIQQNRKKDIYMALFAVALALIVSFYLSNDLSKAINKLKKFSQKIQEGKTVDKLSLKASSEIRDLSDSLNAMADSIHKYQNELLKANRMLKGEKRTAEEKAKKLQEYKIALLNILEDAKEAKQEVEESEEKFRTLVANIPNVFYRCKNDENWTMEFISEAIKDLLGYPPSDFIKNKKRSFLSVIHPDDRQKVEGSVRRALKKKKSWDIVYRLVDNTGAIKWVNEKGRGVYKDGELVWLDGAISDMTKEKEIDKAKDEFVSLASHQLRTPLTSIKWILQKALSRKDELTKWQRNFLPDALDSTERMIGLVGDLLNVSRIEANVLPVKPVDVDLNKFISSIVKESAATAKSKKQKLVFKKTKPSIKLKLDPLLITQVLENLISNAIRYSESGTTIEISTQKAGSKVHISVKDEGIGISESDQKNLFVKFFRSDDASTYSTTGSGLGLYIIDKVLKIHDGKINVRSTKGKGSTFTVVLPIKGPKPREGTKSLIKHRPN